MKPAALAALLKDLPRLKSFVTYHVISGSLPISEFKPGERRTVEGRFLTITGAGLDIRVNGVGVVQPNVAASNGFIHAIDAVLVPGISSLAYVA